jgi:Integrase core domain/GAG-pre-integrase domain
VDSGATDHMINCNTNLDHLTKLKNTQNVYLANGSTTPISETGQINLFGKLIKNILYVPNFPSNLLSDGKITSELNCNVIFSPSYVTFQDRVTERTIGEGSLENGLYVVKQQKCAFNYTKESLNNLWHCRMGHPSDRVLNKMLHLSNLNSSCCEFYNFSKQTKLPFSLSNDKFDKYFQLIHSDVWGPSPIESYDNFKYFIIFIVDFSRAIWLYLLNSKIEVFPIFKYFVKLVSTQYNTQIRILRTDNGTKYVNNKFCDFLNEMEIFHQTICVGTPEQNGIAEWKNRHILEVTHSLIFQSKIPKCFWPMSFLLQPT